MSAAEPKKELYERFPNLGRLTIGIIQHAVEPILGRDAIAAIAEPHVNHDLYLKLCDVLYRTEKRFIEEYPHLDIARGLLHLALSDLKSIQTTFWGFAKNPANPAFPRFLYNQFCNDYPSIEDTKRREAVTLYMKMLKMELISLDDEVRQKLSTSALLSIENNVDSIANTLGSIDKSTKTIADYLLQRNPPSLTETPFVRQGSVTGSAVQKNSIMFMYFGGNEKDARLASSVEQYFSAKYDVISQDILAQNGSDWTEKIEHNIEQSQVIVPIISENINSNELFIYEIEKAFRLFKSAGNPKIIPIRIQYTDPFPYPLSDYISEFPCILVNTLEKNDIRNILNELENGFSGQPYGTVLAKETKKEAVFPRPSPSINPFNYPVLDSPKGTMDPESGLYIERPQDGIMLRNVGRKQALINIKAPRQMGKSSMLVRGVEQARQAGKKIVYLDFQQLDSEHLRDAKSFYVTFCNWIAGNLGIETDADSFWKSPGSNNIKCTRFFKEIILGKLNQPLLLAIDEVDRLLASPFKSDFFGLLRSWHIDRQSDVMAHLSMMLVISTEPVLLIDDIASPFNVGENLNLDDFSPQQIETLNAKHSFPFNKSQLLKLMTLVGGHPYLLRQAMYKVCMNEINAEKLLSTAFADDGPYSDHLLHHLFQINRSAELRDALTQVLKQNTSPSDEITYRLKSAGLVKQIGTSVIPRYGIYSGYFSQHLKGA